MKFSVTKAFSRGWRSRVALITLSIVGLLPSASAAIRPSFALDYSSWHATDIVLVIATERGGVFVVVESLKGELLPGQTIQIPELKPLRNARPISDYSEENLFNIDETGHSSRVPQQIAGSQLILFLKSKLYSDSPEVDRKPTGPEWESANPLRDIKASIVWLYGSKLYGFRQPTNPGPSILMNLEMSQAKLRARVSEIVTLQRQLIQASQIADSQQRAEALKPYVASKIYPASQFALDGLGECGTAAVPTIRGMLDDAAFSSTATALLAQFVRAGGTSVANELVSRLADKLKFWRIKAPTLKEGWWNHATSYAEIESIREQHTETLEIVRGLDKLSYADSLTAVTALRDFWRATPQLNDPSGLNQMADECDKLISKLENHGTSD